MLLQFGMKPMARNLVSLIGTVSGQRKFSNVANVRKNFIDFLDVLQPRETQRSIDGVRFVSDFDDAGVLSSYFSNDSLLDDRAQAQVFSRERSDCVQEKIELLKRGLESVSFIGTGHRELIESIVTDIFIFPSRNARAGSTSQAIGVVWANPKLSYELNDVVEMLVHELTHQLLFLDELCHPYYEYPVLRDSKNWPVSAILKTRRPFDKVLHSAVVAVEILLLRCGFIGNPKDPAVHPPTEMLKRQLLFTIDSMKASLDNGRSILRERGKEVVQILEKNSEMLI